MQPPLEMAGMPAAHGPPVSAKRALEMGGWIKSPLCAMVGGGRGQCPRRPTLPLWGHFSLCSRLLREVQIFCRICGLVGFHVYCFLGETDIQSLALYSPSASPTSPGRCRACFELVEGVRIFCIDRMKYIMNEIYYDSFQFLFIFI